MQKQKLILKTRARKKPREIVGDLAWESGLEKVGEEPDAVKGEMENVQLTVIKVGKMKKLDKVRYGKNAKKQKFTEVEVKRGTGVNLKRYRIAALKDQDKAKLLATKIADLIALKSLTVMRAVLKEKDLIASANLMQPIQIIEKASFTADQIVQSRETPPHPYYEATQPEGNTVSEKAEKALTLIRSMLKETKLLTEKPLVIENVPNSVPEEHPIEEEPSSPSLSAPAAVKRSNTKRSPTGIPGLDELIEGGFARGDLIAVAGKAGTGKSTLAMQFLVKGALEQGEAGVYVTFIEDAATLRRNSASFGWDIKALEKAKKIKILDKLPPMPLDALVKTLQKTVASIRAKRLVIDSITSLVGNSQSPIDPKAFTKLLYQSVKKDGCITLLIAGIDDEENLSFGIEEIVDGIIVLEAVLEGNGIKRRVIIRKMRGTEHSMAYQDVTISNDGVVFRPMPTGRIPKIY
jgi:KaiC/GvpD/RAD55 family RecA-like ATPase